MLPIHTLVVSVLRELSGARGPMETSVWLTPIASENRTANPIGLHTQNKYVSGGLQTVNSTRDLASHVKILILRSSVALQLGHATGGTWF